jgi:hypothetical protein
MKVELSREEVRQALVEYAARKADVVGPFRHSVRINGLWTLMGDGPPPVVVTLERLAMVKVDSKND